MGLKVPLFAFNQENPHWGHTHLTYRIENYRVDFPREGTDLAMEKALGF